MYGPSLLVALVATVSLAPASAQAPASDPAALFVADDRVPLSQFVQGSAGVQVTLNVRSEILVWAVGAGAQVEVANHDGVSVTYAPPTSVNLPAGTVTYTPAGNVDLVVVSSALVNDFPIVTHWNAAANNGRGGYALDATDGIGTVEYSQDSQGVWGRRTTGVGSLKNSDDNHADTFGTFYWNTSVYALFSDGSEVTPQKDNDIADQDVPAYERYIGENWSPHAPTSLAAIALSDRSRELSGLPVAHRNPGPAFDSGAPPTDQLQQGLPILQTVHAYVNKHGRAGGPAGYEDSLATFVVSPNWTPTPAENYRVLFTAFYDIHAATFVSKTDKMFEPLGLLYTVDGEQAIGILSNGGGAETALTQQKSIYKNIEKLFDRATTLLAIDRDRVVVTGGSRGGTSALGLAASPSAAPFTAPYVIASNPTTHPGDALTHHANPTYGLAQASMAALSGYELGPKHSFTGPGGLTGQQLSAQTLYGTSDFALIDSTKANSSQSFIDALLAKGSRIVLRVGTHDFAKSVTHPLSYHAALVSAGVPVRMEISYRFGHSHSIDEEPGELECLRRLGLATQPPFEAGVVHLRPINVAAELALDGTEFTPIPAPMVLEAPQGVQIGQPHAYTIAGPPGTTYAVRAQKVEFGPWLMDPSAALVPLGPEFILLSGTLPPSIHPDSVMTTAGHDLTIQDPASIGLYAYRLTFVYPGGTGNLNPGQETAPPPPDATSLFDWDAQAVWFWGNIKKGDAPSDPTHLHDPTDPDAFVVRGLAYTHLSRGGGTSTDLEH